MAWTMLLKSYSVSLNVPRNMYLKPMTSPTVGFSDSDAGQFLLATGLAGVEAEGRWTNGPNASVTFMLPHSVDGHVIIKIEARAFVWGDALPEQRVTVKVNGAEVATWRIFDPAPRTRAVFVDRETIDDAKMIKIDFELPNCTAPASLNINDDPRAAGIMLRRLTWQAADIKPGPSSLIWQYGRPVGGEARKTFDEKIESGFWSRFVMGPNVLDIGYR